MMLNCCMWCVDDSEFFIIFLLEVYVRKTPSFFAYFASCQLEPDSGAWSIFTSSVERKCEFGACTFVSFM